MKTVSCIASTVLLLAVSVPAKAQIAIHIDPLTFAAVTAQTEMLRDAHKTRTRLQQEIIASETLIHTTMDKIRDIESKAVSYMSSASDAMGAVSQLAESYRTIEAIIDELSTIKKLMADGHNTMAETAVPVLEAMWGDTYSNVKKQAVQLPLLMSQFLADTRAQEPQYDSEGKRTNPDKVLNLLNSAERYQAARSITRRLHNIHNTLTRFRYMIGTATWMKTWQRYGSESYTAYRRMSKRARELKTDSAIQVWANSVIKL